MYWSENMGKHRGRKKMATQYEKGIAIREWRPGYFVVDFQVDNHRIRKAFTDIEDAKIYCRTKRLEIVNKGTHSLVLTDRIRNEALEAMRLLENSGVGLLEVVKDYVRRHPKTQGETVDDTCERYLAAMKVNGRRNLSIAEKRWKFNSLCKDLGTRQTASLDMADIKMWAAQFPSKKAAKHTGAAKSLLAFFHGELKDRRKTDEKPPVTWGTTQVTDLFAKAVASKPEIVPALVVLWFAGLRPNEMLRLQWDQIDLDGLVIRLTGEQTKTRTMRNVAISDNALEWLKAYRGSGPVVASSNRYRTLREELMKVCGISVWPVDVPRHTFATMHYNAHQNAAATMAQLGHFGNSQMFVTHYKGVPVTAEDVAAYWKIVPNGKSVKAEPPETQKQNESAANQGEENKSGKSKATQVEKIDAEKVLEAPALDRQKKGGDGLAPSPPL